MDSPNFPQFTPSFFSSYNEQLQKKKNKYKNPLEKKVKRPKVGDHNPFKKPLLTTSSPKSYAKDIPEFLAFGYENSSPLSPLRDFNAESFPILESGLSRLSLEEESDLGEDLGLRLDLGVINELHFSEKFQEEEVDCLTDLDNVSHIIFRDGNRVEI